MSRKFSASTKVEHEEHEEVQICEETPVALLMRHVADGVNVDEKTDAGDDQQHHQCELIEREGEVCMEGGGLDPGSVAL